MLSQTPENIFCKKKASEFRRTYGLGTAEALNLESLLIDLNVLTVFLPLEGVSGMAVKLSDNNIINRFILVNSNDSIGRQNFTICHELYHLFIQDDFISRACNTGTFSKKDIHELRADLFASNILIPEDAIVRLLSEEEVSKKQDISFPSVLKLSQYFKCSMTSIMVKLSHLGFNGFAKNGHLYIEYSKNIQKRAKEYGYNIDLYMPANENRVIGDYGVISRVLYDTDKISESRYAELMNDIFVNIYSNNISDDPQNG